MFSTFAILQTTQRETIATDAGTADVISSLSIDPFIAKRKEKKRKKK